jgi:DNA-directed RNA polymerase specialized sigma24 family protein
MDTIRDTKNTEEQFERYRYISRLTARHIVRHCSRLLTYHPYVSVDDIYQIADMGLYRALTRYDTDRHANLTAYLFKACKQYVFDELIAIHWLPRRKHTESKCDWGFVVSSLDDLRHSQIPVAMPEYDQAIDQDTRVDKVMKVVVAMRPIHQQMIHSYMTGMTLQQSTRAAGRTVSALVGVFRRIETKILGTTRRKKSVRVSKRAERTVTMKCAS